MARSANLEIMLRAARAAARHLTRDFNEVEHLQVSIKGPGDFVSAADRRAEQVIRDELKRGRPDYGMLLEETGEEVGRSPKNRWIVDPLDGTTNFLHAVPHWSISIALEQHGDVTAALVYDPVKNELFTAEKGNGAYLNERRLRVSRRADMRLALIGCGLPIQDWKGRKSFTRQMERVADDCGGLRRLGTCSLDLAYVAAGRLDGFWEYGPYPWDIAAGILLVREAGGVVTDDAGREAPVAHGPIVAGNPAMHRWMLDVVKQ